MENTTVEDLKQAIQEKTNKRLNEASIKINQLLEEYHCVLIAKPIIMDNGLLSASINLISKD